LGQRMARGADMIKEARKVPQVLWLTHYAAVRNLRGSLEALVGKASAFVRTPKRGVEAAETRESLVDR
jgi:hypothetical protein